MDGVDPLASLISGLTAVRLVTVSFLSVPFLCVWSNIYGWIRNLIVSNFCHCTNNWNYSQFHHSRGLYDVCLGLHHYLQNGGRSGLEIQVDFHEGAVPFSTLLAIYRYRLAHRLLSVRCVLHNINLISFVDQTGGSFSKTACWKMYYASGGS